MNANKSTHTAGERREVIVDILAQTVLELILRGRAGAGAARREPEEEGAQPVELAPPQPAEVCHGSG